MTTVETTENGVLDEVKQRPTEELLAPASESLLETAKAGYAEAMGRDASSIDFLQVDWSRLMLRSARCAVTFGYWRAPLTMELEDLGLFPETQEEREALLKVIQLPKGRLLIGDSSFDPIPAASSVENKGRNVLKAFARPTQLGQVVMLGEKDDKHETAGWHLRDFETAIAAVEQQFYAVREKTRELYPQLTERTLGYWAKLGEQLFGSMSRAGKLKTKREYKLAESDELPTKDEFVGWFLETRVKPYMLTADEAAARFRFKLREEPILPPQALIKAQAEEALDDAELQLRARFIEGAQEAVDTFMRDCVGELRARLFDSLGAALEAMQRGGGVLPARNKTALAATLEYIESVKVWPDRDLEAQLAEMREVLDLPADIREIKADEIKSLFRRIAAESTLVLQELDRADLRTERNIDVPLDGPDLELLAGRKRREIILPVEGDDEVTLNRNRRERKLD